MARTHSMDLTRGSVFKQLIVFAFPVFLTGILQQLYHAADVVVVGNFARDSKVALAAVGSSGALTTLILNLFLGLSLGANVVCANLYGAQKREELDRAMHTAVLTAAIGGVIVALIGVFFARPLLALMGSPDSIIDEAALYMRIIFLGQPANLLYNFGAGILRAHGDTKRPMYILTFSGIVNVLLNLLFVAVFHLDSAGVAIATSISNYVSAAAVLFLLFHPKGEQHLSFSKLKLHKDQFIKVIRIGIPSGLNGVVFSLSNVIIMSAVNSFGDVTIAGNSAAANLEAIVFQILASIYTACVSFSGQNYGARNLKRIDKLLLSSVAMAVVLLVFVDVFIVLFPGFFMGLFTSDAQVIRVGQPRLIISSCGYILYAISEMSVGCTRGMGKTVIPTVLNAFFICAPRIVWILAVFPHYRYYWFLFLCYPISWTLSSVAQLICYFYYRRKEAKRIADRPLSP